MFLWVAVSGIPPSTNLILLILVSTNFDWLNYGILENFFSVTYKWEVYIRVGHFENTETTETEKEEKKGGEETSEKCEELEGKGQALL